LLYFSRILNELLILSVLKYVEHKQNKLISVLLFSGFFEKRESVIFERYEMFASTLNEHFRFGHTFSNDTLEHYGYRKFVFTLCVSTYCISPTMHHCHCLLDLSVGETDRWSSVSGTWRVTILTDLVHQFALGVPTTVHIQYMVVHQ